MTRHTIAATVRGELFALRADWSDPSSPVMIDASAACGAPPGHEWQETGDAVGDWLPDYSPLPLALFYANQSLPEPMDPAAVAVAALALSAAVRVHFDEWGQFCPDDLADLAAATLEREGGVA